MPRIAYLLAVLLFSPATGHAQPTDLHGDALPKGALMRYGSTRLRHGGYIYAVALSPDGKRLASAGGDRRVNLYDSDSGVLLRSFRGHTSAINAVRFSPDGTRLFSASDDETVRVWTVETGKLVRTLANGTDVNDLAVSPDGTRLACAGDDDRVHLWDLATGRRTASLTGHGGDVETVDWSRDGKTLASGSSDDHVILWDPATGAQRKKWKHGETVNALAYSPDGKTLATGGADDKVRLWDAKTGKAIKALAAHAGDVYSLAWTPEGHVVSGGSDEKLIRWNINKGTAGKPLKHGGTVRGIAVHGARVFTAGSYLVKVWDRATGKLEPVHGHHGRVYATAMSHDGRLLATAGEDRWIQLWETKTGKPIRRFTGHTSDIWALAFTPDGKTLVSGSRDESIRFWDVAKGKQLVRKKANKDYLFALALSPDGKTVASGGGDGDSVKLWDVAKRDRRKDWKDKTAEQGRSYSLSWSGDGRRLAAGHVNDIRILDARNAALLLRLKGHKDSVYGVALSPDGGTLVSCSEDDTVRVWDLIGARQIYEMKAHGKNDVYAVAFAPDGRTFASAGGDGIVRVWDVASGKELLALEGHSGGAYTVRYAGPRRLLSGAADTTTLLWDLDKAGLRFPAPAKLDPARLPALWQALGATDARKGHEAAWALSACGNRAAAFIGKHLRPAGAVDDDEVRRLVADLDHRRYARREAASHRLEALGPRVGHILRKVLEKPQPLERKERVESLLRDFARREHVVAPAELGTVRAVRVLERIGTPAARATLQQLAAGAATARSTVEAKASLARLDAR